ncbi:hypothetical protein [Trueperella pyogenes]|uniref:hypothetical protein n=1 Tax=Trueperella pyogenes TaxID=1661 RepID=UPI00324CDA96
MIAPPHRIAHTPVDGAKTSRRYGIWLANTSALPKTRKHRHAPETGDGGGVDIALTNLGDRAAGQCQAQDQWHEQIGQDRREDEDE